MSDNAPERRGQVAAARGWRQRLSLATVLSMSSDRKFTRALVALEIATLAAAVALALPRASHAHGSYPAVLGVVADEAEGRRVLALAGGLADERGDGSWTYVCPAVWGGPWAPISIAAPDGGVWVFGERGATLVIDGVVAAQPVGTERIDHLLTRAATSSDEETYVLVRTDAGQEVVALRGDSHRTAALLTPRWDTIVWHDGELLVADVDETAVTLARISDTGDAADEQRLERTPVDVDDPGTASLRTAGGEVFVEVRSFEGAALYRVVDGELVEVFASSAPIHGPVLALAVDGGAGSVDGDAPPTLWAVSDGSLVELEGSSTRILRDDPRLTCLDGRASGVYGCAQLELYALDASAATALVFDHDALLEPRLEILPFEDRARCDAEWVHYALHAGIPVVRGGDDGAERPVDDAGSGDAEEPARDDRRRGGGCAAALHSSPPPSWPWSWCVAAALVAATRRRQTRQLGFAVGVRSRGPWR